MRSTKPHRPERSAAAGARSTGQSRFALQQLQVAGGGAAVVLRGARRAAHQVAVQPVHVQPCRGRHLAQVRRQAGMRPNIHALNQAGLPGRQLHRAAGIKQMGLRSTSTARKRP